MRFCVLGSALLFFCRGAFVTRSSTPLVQSNVEVLELVKRVDDPWECCEELVSEAAQRWDSNDVDKRRDDITAMILKVG